MRNLLIPYCHHVADNMIVCLRATLMNYSAATALILMAEIHHSATLLHS